MKSAAKKTENPKYILRPVAELAANPQNARTHTAAQIKKIAKSIEKFGFMNPVIADESGKLVAGHGRLEAAKNLKLEQIPCIAADHLTDAEKRAYMLADNRIALESGWDSDLLKIELDELAGDGFDLEFTGFDQDEIDDFFKPESINTGKLGTLSEKFLVPPFSVLSARDGWWQDRKRGWMAKGIQSELGRGDNLLKMLDQAKLGGGYGKSKFGKCLETGIGEKYGRDEMNGTSIFDPVLCELAYSWFCPPQGLIIDPFAGGSVRGVMASFLGRQYFGVDLRAEQIEANEAQAKEMFEMGRPEWLAGDSRDIAAHAKGKKADFIFSCPPYADLEVYSDDPQDLSTLGYDDFRAAYFEIIKESCALLKEDRFACFVVGEARDKRGNYYDFVGDTVDAFRAAGLEYYNEIILVTAVGSLPIRAGKTFASSRKVGKTHQNVLVFCKGDAKKAAAACGDVEVHVPEPDDQD